MLRIAILVLMMQATALTALADAYKRFAVVVQNQQASYTDVGTGALVDLGGVVLVVTNHHVAAEPPGRLRIVWPDGGTSAAQLIWKDEPHDIAFLKPARESSIGATVGDVDPRGVLTIAGMRGGYHELRGRIADWYHGNGTKHPYVALSGGQVRSGDSGSGIYNERGEIVGVVWGAASGQSYGSIGGAFYDAVVAVRQISCQPGMPCYQPPGYGGGGDGRGVSRAPAPQIPPAPIYGGPAQIAPVQPPAPGYLAPVQIAPIQPPALSPTESCNCADDLAELGTRLGKLESGSDDYARRSDLPDFSRFATRDEITDQLTAIDRGASARSDALADRLERLSTSGGPGPGDSTEPPSGSGGGFGWREIAAIGFSIAGPIGVALPIAAWVARRGVSRRLGGRRRKKANFRPQVAETPPATQAPKPAGNHKTLRKDESEVERWEGSKVQTATFQPIERNLDEAAQLLQLSRLEGRDPLQDALMGRLAGDRLESDSDNPSIDATIRNYARDLRRDLAERFNEIAPTKMSATVPQH